MSGAPRSKQFDDVYYSAENGFAETMYVYLDGNNLPERWQGRERFVIAETGFGTGLNFLCAWKLFNDTAKSGQKMEFISVEKFPLSAHGIQEALKPWEEKFPEEFKTLVEKYPADCSGTQRIVMGEDCVLTLVFGDVNYVLPKIEEQVDCWFLDGFKPKKNPEMWTEIVFQNMARLSPSGATFATFTAAGMVRRGLREVGFEVKRINGYGYKWHMLVGTKI